MFWHLKVINTSWLASCDVTVALHDVTVGCMTYVDELFLFLVRHLGERVVGALELSLQTVERLDDNALRLATLSARARGRQRQAADAATSAHARGEHVLLVEIRTAQLNTEE